MKSAYKNFQKKIEISYLADFRPLRKTIPEIGAAYDTIFNVLLLGRQNANELPRKDSHIKREILSRLQQFIEQRAFL